jgi:hypothetical protein
MEDEFLGNFEKFELMAFFSGFAIVYLIMNGIWRSDRIFGMAKGRIFSYGYALTATLFLGYTARKLFMGSGLEMQFHFYHPFLYLFGLLAVLFWIPALTGRSMPILVHSLVFFSMIPLDIISYFRGTAGRDQIRNDMNMLSLSIIFNVSTLILVFIFLWLIRKLSQKTG